MSSIAMFLVFLALSATAITLFLGVFTMARGKDERRSNRLMVMRVVLQAATILLLLIAVSV